MNPIVRDKWVAALRSGEYQQGTHVLHNVQKNTHCCLGVLCDLAVKEGIVKKVVDLPFNIPTNMITLYDGSYGGLPGSVLKWSGLSSGTKLSLDDDTQAGFIALNDQKRLSFNEIADLIEKQL